MSHERKPAAIVVTMPAFTPRIGKDALLKQVNDAFPGVPVIFADQGTQIEIVHATE